MSKLIESIRKKKATTLEDFNALERAGELEAYFLAFMAERETNHGLSEKSKTKIANDLAVQYRRETYETNHAKIKGAILNHVKENNSMPSVATISKVTELSRQTVYTHLQTFDLSEYFPDETKKYQVAFMGIMDVLLGRCMSGDIKAMRLYFDIMAFANRRNPEAGFLLGKPNSNPNSELTHEERMARIEGLHAKMGMKLVPIES